MWYSTAAVGLSNGVEGTDGSKYRLRSQASPYGCRNACTSIKDYELLVGLLDREELRGILTFTTGYNDLIGGRVFMGLRVGIQTVSGKLCSS